MQSTSPSCTKLSLCWMVGNLSDLPRRWLHFHNACMQHEQQPTCSLSTKRQGSHHVTSLCQLPPEVATVSRGPPALPVRAAVGCQRLPAVHLPVRGLGQVLCCI